MLYNPLAGNGNADTANAELVALLPNDEMIFRDITGISDYTAELGCMEPDARILLVGGDGTLNRFLNDVDGLTYTQSVWYYAAGNGNDFWNDLGKKRGDAPACIDGYLKDLPVVTVNGKRSKFINGVGFGIDGYCCETGDDLRAAGKKVDYTAIAVKGLLFHFKPRKATVIVDGKEYVFKKTWIAPTMVGRYYGGGMIPTPEQDRNDPERKVSVCVMHGTGKLHTLMIFPSIFKGEHVKKKKAVATLSGKQVTIRFDKPCALQIDGETIRGVTEYTVAAGKSAE